MPDKNSKTEWRVFFEFEKYPSHTGVTFIRAETKEEAKRLFYIDQQFDGFIVTDIRENVK